MIKQGIVTRNDVRDHHLYYYKNDVFLKLFPAQSTLVYWLPYSSHTYHHPSETLCLPWIPYATQKLMNDSCKMVEKQSEAFHTFLWLFFFQVKNRILLNIVLLKCRHVQIAFLKFTSCDNQALVGCIPIASWLECSPMAWENWVQSQVESYQRLKKWYLMPPCLTLSIIRYGSRVK